ncbi:hypothetical protein A8C56_19050 [Niabella ginsenosidivorans]|uniref:Uncharacterized protein n=1 Tax=Niabella ginsenosidivorans TaxID=1176587 RepID=A0A1A9I6X5_9BACT|nr:hypothetical protein [Niabella ginsenosidivorans]ANH82799.1 hypothetical protein A8C56_19050 [Niabella ginsenosidivorans]
MITDKEQQKQDKEPTQPEPDPKTTDPQDTMEGPVSSLLQRGKEIIEEKGAEKGHKENEEEQKE